MNDLTCTKQFKRDTVTLILTKLDAAETPSDFLAQVGELSVDPDWLLDRDSIDFEEPLSADRPDSANAEILFEAVGQIDRVNAALPWIMDLHGLQHLPAIHDRPLAPRRGA